MPTEILYGSTDNLQSIDTINEFVNDNGAGLTVMESGEHWFHTKEQMRFWIDGCKSYVMSKYDGLWKWISGGQDFNEGRNGGI